MVRKSLIMLLTMLALAFCASGEANAQTVIWLVPSTDTAPPGSRYIELDGIVNPRPYDQGGYTAIGVRTIFGTGNNTELGVNLFGTMTNTPNPVELQPNFKLKLYSDEQEGLALSVGTMLYLPVANQSYGGDTFGTAYVVGSKTFAGDNGPRLSIGAWGLYGRDSGTGSTSGLMFGLEQPINADFTFAVDHMTGNQVHGGFSSTTAGIIGTVSPDTTFGIAYTWANQGQNNNGPFGWVGVKF